MKKADLIDKISQKTDLSRTASSKALNGCLDTIQELLSTNNRLCLTGFGTFSIAERKERKGRNPQTGEEITIPAGKVVKFKPGKNLKNELKSL